MGQIVCKEPKTWLLSQLSLSAKCFCQRDFFFSFSHFCHPNSFCHIIGFASLLTLLICIVNFIQGRNTSFLKTEFQEIKYLARQQYLES